LIWQGRTTTVKSAPEPASRTKISNLSQALLKVHVCYITALIWRGRTTTVKPVPEPASRTTISIISQALLKVHVCYITAMNSATPSLKLATLSAGQHKTIKVTSHWHYSNFMPVELQPRIQLPPARHAQRRPKHACAPTILSNIIKPVQTCKTQPWTRQLPPAHPTRRSLTRERGRDTSRQKIRLTITNIILTSCLLIHSHACGRLRPPAFSSPRYKLVNTKQIKS